MRDIYRFLLSSFIEDHWIEIAIGDEIGKGIEKGKDWTGTVAAAVCGRLQYVERLIDAGES